MKKYLLLSVLSLFSYGVFSQEDTIHWGYIVDQPLSTQIFVREYPYDTVHFGDSAYLFNSPYDLDYYFPWGTYTGIIPISVMQYVVSSKSQLHGVAVAGYVHTKNQDTARIVYVAYKKENGQMLLLDTLDFNNYYTVNAFEHIETDRETGEHHYFYPYLYEYYFDEQYSLAEGDTIYVGLYDITRNWNFQQQFAVWLMGVRLGGYGHPVWVSRTQDGDWQPSSWSMNGLWGGIFPIVQPDKPRCRVPQQFSLADRTLASATFTWAAKPCDCEKMQLQLYTLDSTGRPSDSLIHPVHGDTAVTVEGLDTGVYYTARLRSRCHHICPSHDTVVYSPWTAAVRFYLGETEPTLVDTTLAVPGAEAWHSQGGIQVHPNPTAGLLTVTLPESLQGATLSLYDLEGRLQLERRVETLRLTLDLRPLPAGTYLLRAGSHTQRVVKH